MQRYTEFFGLLISTLWADGMNLALGNVDYVTRKTFQVLFIDIMAVVRKQRSHSLHIYIDITRTKDFHFVLGYELTILS